MPSGRYDSWKTVCLGRYLVDVPTGIPINYLGWFRNDWSHEKEEVTRVPGVATDVKKMAEAKARELQAQPHDTQGTLYIRSYALSNGAYLVHGWKFDFTVRSSEIFMYIPVTTRGVSYIYTYYAYLDSDEEQKQLKDLAAFASSFRPLEKGVIPDEDGLCFDDIMFINVPDAFVDDFGLNFRDPHAKGLTMFFGVRTTLSVIDWLTKEPGWAEEECHRLEGSKACDELRFGRHDVGSIQGEEICIAGHTSDGKYRTYTFEWNNPGVEKSKASPELTVALHYKGIPVGYPTAPIPFSTDAEALATWDRFVNSIRLRPVKQ